MTSILKKTLKSLGLTLAVVVALTFILTWVSIIAYINTKNPAQVNFTPLRATSTAVLGTQELKLALYEEATLNGLTYWEFRKLKRIAQCESRWEPDAYNKKTGDHSIFQINKVHIVGATEKGLDLDDPLDNIEFAVGLYSEKGSRPWNSSRECWYN